MRFEYGVLWVGRVPEAFHARFLVSVRSLYGDSPPREGGKNSAEWTKQRRLHSTQDNKTQTTVPQLPSSGLTVAYLATKAAGWFISREQELLLDYFKGISREPSILTGIFAQENDWIYQWRTIRASHLRSIPFWKILALYCKFPWFVRMNTSCLNLEGWAHLMCNACVKKYSDISWTS